jgi:hypothetical protein
MRWTLKAPTEPGYYWLCLEDDLNDPARFGIELVIKHKNGKLRMAGRRNISPEKYAQSFPEGTAPVLWGGPIPRPEGIDR